MNVNSVNSTSFEAKAKKAKQPKEYKRTDMFKITGAAIGAIGSGAAAIITNKSNPEFMKELGKGRLFGAAAGITLICAGLGAFFDTIINKTVKNTVASIKNNKTV